MQSRRRPFATPPARDASGGRAADWLARVRDELLAALAPPACAACRAPLPRAHGLLCGDCRAELPWLTGPRCARCGAPGACGATCPARDAAYAGAWAPLAHDGPARALVAALKFRGALPVADVMAAQMAAVAPPGVLDGAPLVPVPLHPARRRARGFDQSARIAAAIARRRGLPLAACLVRGGAPTRQLGASRSARLAAGERLAIAVRGPAPARAVLVDDVWTTGATFEACARALRAAGCAHVTAIAYARTPPR